MQDRNTAWAAARQFRDLDKADYDLPMFHPQYKKADQIIATSTAKRRISGAGQTPALGKFEKALSDEILELQ